MSGLFSNLTSITSSLQAHTRAIELAGRNLSNVNNPAYARQRAILSNLSGSRSLGLTVVGYEHARDSILDRQLLSEISLSSGLEAKQFRLSQVLASLGETIDRTAAAKFIDETGSGTGGLRNSINTFFNSFESFAARPNDPAAKQLLLQHAESLVQDFHRIDARLSGMQDDLATEIGVEVGAFNHHLETIDTLNREIAKIELTAPGSALDLRDRRQAELEKLAELGAIQTWETAGTHGQITVAVTGPDGESIVLVEPENGVKQLELDATGGSLQVAGSGETIAIESGRLSALLQVKDEAIADIRAELDQLAASLASDVNGIYGLSGSSFFAPGDLTAGGLELEAGLTPETLVATATGVSGANELALELAGLVSEKHEELGGLSYSEHAIAIVTNLGQDVQNIEIRKEVQENVRAMIQSRRDSVSGVSLDEEVAHLMQSQRAFEASARVFNTISELLDTVVNGLG